MTGKKLRVAIGGFVHETSSFSNDYADKQLFQNTCWYEKDDLIEWCKGNHMLVGGYLEYATEKDWDIVPLFACNGVPAGPITGETYEYIKSQLVGNLKGERLDGILLHLHGAGVSAIENDCEGDVLESIGKEVGDDIPIMVVLDLHGNISKKMCDNATAMFGYNTQPHEDGFEREKEAAALLEKTIAENLKVCTVMAQPPILLPAIYTDTTTGAMKIMIEKAFEMENKYDEIINVSPFAGFYGSDMYNTGSSVVVVTEEKNKGKGIEVAKEVADFFWENKEPFFVEPTPIPEAMKIAEKEGGMWCFIDEADDPMGAGPGDGTYIMEQLMKLGVKSAAIVAIHDHETVAEAFKAGLGGTVKVTVGSKKDKLHGNTIPMEAEVVNLHEGKIPMWCWDESLLQNPGKIAVIRQGGISVVVTELKTCTESIDIFKYLGMKCTDFNIMVLKGLGETYRVVYEDIAKGFFTVESIGITNPDVRRIGEFKNIRRPVYPLDENVEMRYE